eukprot:gene12349-biopygen12437
MTYYSWTSATTGVTGLCTDKGPALWHGCGGRVPICRAVDDGARGRVCPRRDPRYVGNPLLGSWILGAAGLHGGVRRGARGSYRRWPYWAVACGQLRLPLLLLLQALIHHRPTALVRRGRAAARGAHPAEMGRGHCGDMRVSLVGIQVNHAEPCEQEINSTLNLY